MKRGIKRERFERLLRKAKLCNRFPNVGALVSLSFYCEVPVSHIVGDVKYRQVGAISVGERVHGIRKNDILIHEKTVEVSVSNNHGNRNVVIGRNEPGTEEIVKVYEKTRRGRLFPISRNSAYRLIREVETLNVLFPEASSIKFKTRGHPRAGTRGVEMKNKNGEKTSAKKAEKTVKKEKVKEEKREVHRCDQCKHYDVSTQRDFHRNGIREGLVEVRAVCRSPKSKARNHLVKNDSDRPCFEEGVYEKPKKKDKKKEVVKAEEKTVEPTSPADYHGPDLTDVEKEELNDNTTKVSKKNIASKKVTEADQRKIKDVVVKDSRNGQVKNFEKKNGKLVLVKQ